MNRNPYPPPPLGNPLETMPSEYVDRLSSTREAIDQPYKSSTPTPWFPSSRTLSTSMLTRERFKQELVFAPDFYSYTPASRSQHTMSHHRQDTVEKRHRSPDGTLSFPNHHR